MIPAATKVLVPQVNWSTPTWQALNFALNRQRMVDTALIVSLSGNLM